MDFGEEINPLEECINVKGRCPFQNSVEVISRGLTVYVFVALGGNENAISGRTIEYSNTDIVEPSVHFVQ